MPSADPVWPPQVLQTVRGGQDEAGEDVDEAEQVGHIGVSSWVGWRPKTSQGAVVWAAEALGGLQAAAWWLAAPLHPPAPPVLHATQRRSGRPLPLPAPAPPTHPPHPHPETPLFPLQDLTRFVRSKAHSKRALTSIYWQLGPKDDDLRLAVKLYALTQPQKPPAVGAGAVLPWVGA